MILYRAEARSYAYCVDPDYDEWASTAPKLVIDEYEVLRWTPNGATLKVMSGARHKWVDLTGDRQWASRTREEAIDQFRLRRERQMYVLKRQLARAEYERQLAITASQPPSDRAGVLGQQLETTR